jgi:hypothetical protein
MILTESDAQERLESPLNLINRLRGGMTPSNRRITHPAIPPTAEELIPNLNEKINIGSIKSKAAEILVDTLGELKNRLSEVTKPSQLASIATQMGKIVGEMEEKTKNDNRVGQIIIYAPRVVKEDEFETIDVSTGE